MISFCLSVPILGLAKRQSRMIPVAGYPIYQAVAKMDLIVFNVRTRDIEDYLIFSVMDTHICAHLARVTAYARGGKLYLG